MSQITSATQYDIAFGNVKELAWLPWVGSNFPQRPANKKLLVVGESHYEARPEYREWWKNPDAIRGMIKNYLEGDEWGSIPQKLPKLLFNTDTVNKSKLWGDIAFYNFVQRLMESASSRPTKDDFLKGWKVLVEVVKIIQPSHCLFIGVSAANFFDTSMLGRELTLGSEMVVGAYPRVGKLKTDGVTTKLIFVRHFSRCPLIQWQIQWHDYLHTQHADLMGWLEEEPYGFAPWCKLFS